jgi:transketolase C-terminal domain/subunit
MTIEEVCVATDSLAVCISHISYFLQVRAFEGVQNSQAYERDENNHNSLVVRTTAGLNTIHDSCS